MTQAPLFPDTLKSSPETTSPTGRKRLRGQNKRLLDRLRLGKVANTELSSTLCLNYTARVSEVRAWLELQGETIRCTRGKGGICWYEIVKL